MKTELRKGGCKALNIYVTKKIGSPFGEALGFSLFPYECHDICALDGAFVVTASLQGGTAAPFNQGDTVTHEVGHWMGLYHTFMGGTAEIQEQGNPECIDMFQRVYHGHYQTLVCSRIGADVRVFMFNKNSLRFIK